MTQRLISAFLILGGLVGFATHASAQCSPTKVYPLITNVTPQMLSGEAATVFSFGYVNSDSVVCSVPLGVNNFFDKGNFNKGQARNFEPGTHYDVFTVTVPRSAYDSLSWIVGGHAALALHPPIQPELVADSASTLLRAQVAGIDRMMVTNDHFIVHAPAGAAIYSDAARTVGVILEPNAGAWSVTSDIRRKRDFVEVDGEVLLEKLGAMRIGTWSYATQDASIRHLGPSAQEFRAAFGLGESDTTISTVDAAGVGLAALQALLRRTEDLERRLANLERDGVTNTKPATAVRIVPETPVERDADVSLAADTILVNVQTSTGEQRLFVTNQSFTATAPGGARIYSGTSDFTGVALPAGSGSWVMTSDRTKKHAFAPMDANVFEGAVPGLPIGTWRYSGAAPGVRHIGTTAQAFRAAFHLGSSATSINEIDAFGVNLYGAQLLHTKLQHIADALSRMEIAR